MIPQATGWPLTVVVLALGIVSCRGAQALEPVAPAPREATREETAVQPARAGHVAGELLLKLTPDAGQLLDAALTQERLPTETGLAWLDELNRRYGVTIITPLFTHQSKLDAMKAKFPERSRRAPPGEQPTAMTQIYKLTLSADADLSRAIADYQAQPDVVYAEPNRIATIQREN